jgi:hypothetical protein
LLRVEPVQPPCRRRCSAASAEIRKNSPSPSSRRARSRCGEARPGYGYLMRGMRYVPHMKTHATSVEVGEIGPTAEVVEHGGPPVVDGEEDQPRRGVCQVREVTRRSIASRDRGIEAQDFPSSQLRPTETLQGTRPVDSRSVRSQRGSEAARPDTLPPVVYPMASRGVRCAPSWPETGERSASRRADAGGRFADATRLLPS